MVDGVHGLVGPLAQSLVRVVSTAEAELVTARRQNMGAMNARLMAQVTPKQNPVTPTHVQVRKSLSKPQKVHTG